ncbi:LLM class flavin-dependent oxidoreductase [Amycolatopsis sp. NPDC051371]|uniref:LLM class flavin-dependent oxidoreductase n=1 Tax=Amycolatopsis sp. NPDC051371 TaxID=3155800 RepID=UPI00342E24CA
MAEVKFGALLEPSADRPQDVVGWAELMERLGYDLVTLSDHPYWPERLDTIALLSAIVARTRRITVLPNLLNLPLRPPAVIARTASTLDILSGGRFELGLGTGAQQMWESIVAEGGPARTAGQSIEAREEATHLIRALWSSTEDVDFRGAHYRLDGVRPVPGPCMRSASGSVPTRPGCFVSSAPSATAGSPAPRSSRRRRCPRPTGSSTRPRGPPAGRRGASAAATTSKVSSAPVPASCTGPGRPTSSRASPRTSRRLSASSSRDHDARLADLLLAGSYPARFARLDSALKLLAVAADEQTRTQVQQIAGAAAS